MWRFHLFTRVIVFWTFAYSVWLLQAFNEWKQQNCLRIFSSGRSARLFVSTFATQSHAFRRDGGLRWGRFGGMGERWKGEKVKASARGE